MWLFAIAVCVRASRLNLMQRTPENEESAVAAAEAERSWLVDETTMGMKGHERKRERDGPTWPPDSLNKASDFIMN